MKTLDKPYDLRALKTVNWVMAISDHKRQEASRVSPTAAPILVQSFRAMLREGDPEPDRLPELRKTELKSRHQGHEGREQARRVTDKRTS